VKIGYARVSKGEQNEALQIDALVAAGVDRRHIHVDKVSGRLQDRKGLAAALELIEPGDDLVIWKLDRLGRSASKLISLVQDLQARDIGFVVTTQPLFNTRTTEGKFLLILFAGLAEMEVNLTSERIKAGQASGRKRGRLPGRKKAIDADTVDAAIAWLDNGAIGSLTEASKMFKVKRPTLHRAIAHRRSELKALEGKEPQ
jgi:DNA invertase Pin-like site-specific DNA recombinase